MSAAMSQSDTTGQFIQAIQDIEFEQDTRFPHRRIDEVSELVIQDLLEINPMLRQKAEQGEIVYKKDYRFDEKQPRMHTDLVLGKREYRVEPESGLGEYEIAEVEPDDVWLVIDIGIFTSNSHRHNIHRRLSRWNSICLAANHYEDTVVCGGIGVFIDENDQGNEGDSPELEEFLRDSFNRISDRIFNVSTASENATFDTWGAIVVENHGDKYEMVTEAPAPQQDERIHFENVLSELSGKIDTKFFGLPEPHTADIERYLGGMEGRTVEFKQEVPSTKRNLAEDAVALANTDGGLIVVGINDSGELDPLDNPIDTVRSDVNDILQGHTDGLDYRIEIEEIDKVKLVVIRVPQSDGKLHDVHGSFYTRRGQQSVPMDFSDLERFFQKRFVREHNLDELL